MANKKNHAEGVNKNSNKEASNNSPLFAVNNKESLQQKENEQDILQEIKKAMAEGVYNKNEEVQNREEDDNDAKIFITNDIPLANKKDKAFRLVAEKKSKELTAEQIAKKEKKEAKKAAYKKTTFKHKLKVLVALMILGTFTGSGLGVWYFNFALKSNVDYSADPDDFVQSIDETLTKNFAGINLEDKENWMNYIDGKSPADLNAADNLVLTFYNASLATSYTSIGEGNIVTGITPDQFMYSERKFDGNSYSFVSISPTTNAFVGDIAVCDILGKGSKLIKSYEGPLHESNKSADWEYVASYTTDKYEEMSGVAVDDLQAYIVGEKTIVSSSEIQTDENGNYIIKVKLDNINSVLKYVRQVKRTGGLDSYPEFLSIEQTYTITQDWQLVSIYTEEVYKALKMVARPTIHATMTTNFTFNEPVTMPQVPPTL